MSAGGRCQDERESRVREIKVTFSAEKTFEQGLRDPIGGVPQLPGGTELKAEGRGRSRLHAGSPMQDSIPGPRDHNLSCRQMLNP